MERGQLSFECSCTPVGDVDYDASSDASTADAVVAAVAAVTDTEPGDLQPPYETIDPDAPNRLFDGRAGGPEGAEKVLGFSMAGWNVFVGDDGRIRVCDPTGPADPSPIFD